MKRPRFIQNIQRGSFSYKILKNLYKRALTFKTLAIFFTPLNNNLVSITSINLEFASHCNLRCKWCSLDHKKKRELLDEKTLRKFLDNLIFDKRFRKVNTLRLWNGGEILLHPNLIELLKIIKEYKLIAKKRNLNFPKIEFLTNGMLFNKKIQKQILDLDLIDVFRFSIDGGSKERFEEIRKGAKWDIVFKNLSDFKKINNGRAKTSIICILAKPELNTKHVTDEFRKVFDLVDDYSLRNPNKLTGVVKLDIPKEIEDTAEIKFKRVCPRLMNGIVVLPNGDVTICCIDLNSVGVVGNIHKNSLYNIYNSKARRNIVKKILKGKKKEIYLCKNCEALK